MWLKPMEVFNGSKGENLLLSFTPARRYHSLQPGDTIVVPVNEEYQPNWLGTKKSASCRLPEHRLSLSTIQALDKMTNEAKRSALDAQVGHDEEIELRELFAVLGW